MLGHLSGDGYQNQEISRKKPNIKNRVSQEVERGVCDIAFEYPAYGQQRASNELKKRGIFVSPGGVRSIWVRHGLELRQDRPRQMEYVNVFIEPS